MKALRFHNARDLKGWTKSHRHRNRWRTKWY